LFINCTLIYCYTTYNNILRTKHKEVTIWIMRSQCVMWRVVYSGMWQFEVQQNFASFLEVHVASIIKAQTMINKQRRIYKEQALILLLASRKLLGLLTSLSWKWRQRIPPKCQRMFTGMYGVISPKPNLLSDYGEMIKLSYAYKRLISLKYITSMLLSFFFNSLIYHPNIVRDSTYKSSSTASHSIYCVFGICPSSGILKI
jgi:hypothetical protein